MALDCLPDHFRFQVPSSAILPSSVPLTLALALTLTEVTTSLSSSSRAKYDRQSNVHRVYNPLFPHSRTPPAPAAAAAAAAAVAAIGVFDFRLTFTDFLWDWTAKVPRNMKESKVSLARLASIEAPVQYVRAQSRGHFSKSAVTAKPSFRLLLSVHQSSFESSEERGAMSPCSQSAHQTGNVRTIAQFCSLLDR